jgi:hypothetical protein
MPRESWRVDLALYANVIEDFSQTMLTAVASSASRASCLRVRLTATATKAARTLSSSPSHPFGCQRGRLDALFSTKHHIQHFAFSTSARRWQAPERIPITPPEQGESTNKPAKRENIYTIPNALTVSRIISCPILGWAILDGNYTFATGLLFYAGLTDWVCLLSFESQIAFDGHER